MTRTARIVVLIAAPVIAAAVASTAHAHARLKNPTPRDNRDGYKDMTPPGTGAPCGITRTAAQPSSNLTPGATVTVTWEETVNHPGCFVLDFSAANDGNFQVIGRKSHMNAPTPNPTTQSPRQWSMSVTLPSAPCTACTLRLRQMMLPSEVSEANLATGCPPATVPANSTYYSCANVVLGGASGTGGSSGGTGGATGTGGRGGNTAGGRGGTLGTGGAAGTSGQAGNGASGAAGDNGQAGTSGQAGSGASGEAGTTGQAGSGSSGQAGVTGQAGNGSSGAAGSGGATGTGTGQAGSGGDEASGGCQVTGGAPAPLALLLALALVRRRRRRSRS